MKEIAKIMTSWVLLRSLLSQIFAFMFPAVFKIGGNSSNDDGVMLMVMMMVMVVGLMLWCSDLVGVGGNVNGRGADGGGSHDNGGNVIMI